MFEPLPYRFAPPFQVLVLEDLRWSLQFASYRIQKNGITKYENPCSIGACETEEIIKQIETLKFEFKSSKPVDANQ
jgi:hypothetical protein